MNIRLSIYISIAFLVLMGSITACIPLSLTSSEENSNKTPIPTVITPTIITNASTIGPAPSVTSPSTKFLNNKCAEKVETSSERINSTGVIVLYDPHNPSVALLDAEKQNTNFLQHDSSAMRIGSDIFVSPNRKWLIYVRVRDEKEISLKDIVMMKADGSLNKIIHIPSNWHVFSWLDNDNLEVSVFEPQQVVTTMLFNPFTEKQQILVTDFPERYDLNPQPWTIDVIYSPNQRYAVYPSITDQEYTILYDLKLDEIKARIPMKVWSLSPKWSPDGNFISLINFRPLSLPAEKGIYLVGKDGVVDRLFADVATENFVIGSYEWSPVSPQLSVVNQPTFGSIRA